MGWDINPINIVKRGAAALGTGGLSELGGFRTADDLTGGHGQQALGKITGFFGDTFGNPDPVSIQANHADYAGAADEYNPYLDWVKQQQGYQIDPSQMDASRGLTLQAAQSYQQALANPQDTAAQQQMRSGLAAAQGQAVGLAASARGGPGAALLAQQNAQRTGAGLALAGNNQSAQLQAQEMAAARAGLGQLGGQLYGQDQQRQALLAQQANANLNFQNQGRLAATQGRAGLLGQYASDQTNAQATAAGVNAQNQQAAAGRRAALISQAGQIGAKAATGGAA